ncbi:MAG: hypothetical protein BZ138_04505 [Methanosphaera sp. rholeuAM270]|nr:MAG: hypothetical protein BZ138_04505 [Methanosphaera sp. rholeuAM270]
MDFILALGGMLLSVVLVIISMAITFIVGVTLANFLHLTGMVWWAFIILFWLVITSIINNTEK